MIRAVVLFFALWLSSTLDVTQTAAADAVCETEFRALLRQERSGFPYMSEVITNYSGKLSKVHTGARSKSHALTIHENGTWYLVIERITWQSSDEGKTWKKLTAISQKLYDKSLAEQEKQAVNAYDITCDKDVKYEEGTSNWLKGKFVAANGTGIVFDQSYYVNNDGIWVVVVSDITIGSNKSKVTQTKLGSDMQVNIPDAPQ